MASTYFKILSLNCRRFERLDKLLNIKVFCDLNLPDFICFQEIFISNFIKVFNQQYQIYVNFEKNQQIGVAVAIKKDIEIIDFAMCNQGRIIGIKLSNTQVWNVYAPSGSGNKKARETLFRESLPNLMSIWKDATSNIIQAGDHNCTQRYADSENIAWQKHHVQPGLLSRMECFGLRDELLNIRGKDVQDVYSRVTNVSKTRIDFIMSNTNLCREFEYLDTNFLGLDHKASLATYDIKLGKEIKMRIPKHLYFSGWVIPKQLEYDEEFIQNTTEVFDEIVEGSEDVEDWTYIWTVGKYQMIEIAKAREHIMKKQRMERKCTLQVFLRTLLRSIANGHDRWQEFNETKNALIKISDKEAEDAVDLLKFEHIKDHLYDVQKLKAQKRYENKGKIDNLVIEGNKYHGTENVVKGIKEKLTRDLSKFGNHEWDDPPSEEESFLLDKVKRCNFSDAEKVELMEPITEEEVRQILFHEVDLDSSPGEDGITYRILRKLVQVPSFSRCLVKMLDHIKTKKSMGILENVGIMKLLNKKLPSDIYEKKRKLTMVNKSENSLSGMIWTKRLKKFILPKVLPKFQYICQEDQNVTDENRELRNVVNLLKSNNNDGTIIALDFKDAFRSTSLRWCNLVMKAMNIPSEFISWFWAMYENLSVSVVINKYSSEKILVKRGFMEGHAPSMGAFVIAASPLGHALEEVLEGIETEDGVLHKVKAFADDVKVFLKDIDVELKKVYEIIGNFERVSGTEMHRDPSREKCQALPFGIHKQYQDWPSWVTVKNEIKILGVYYSNDESLEKCNSKIIFEKVNGLIMGNFSMRGTPLQKAAFANTYIFSKIWYVAQTIKLEPKIMKNISQKVLKFIWAGQNERPVNALNFRPKELGGLGLMCPETKGRSLLLKSMAKDYVVFGNQKGNIGKIYGYSDEFIKLLELGVDLTNVKQIYNHLIHDKIFRNGSLIPSREEKRTNGVKWKKAWLNLQNLRGTTAEEKYFMWQSQQDMLPVGSRLHRPNAEKRCLAVLKNDEKCLELNDKYHALISCSRPPVSDRIVEAVLSDFLERTVTEKEILHFSFNHRSKKRLRIAVWFTTKILFLIYLNNFENKFQLLAEMQREIEWNLKMSKGMGSVSEILALKECILRV